ncbi:MAG TPA: hypothetical protein VHX38_02205 [Pseudonocardiaceae bacterium]|jgi:uncharacterized membrane protein YphA (DoxX/SURF4 family)|nr:hypothetical protein [Pseudonocardiaceae bacterium]
MLQRLKGLLQYEPAVLAWAVNGGIALVIGYLTPLSAGQTGAITVVTGALATIYTAFMARPVSVSVITGALATIATYVGYFGLHLDPAVVTAAISVVGTLLGLLLRPNVTPKVTVKLKPGPDGVYRAAA